MSLSVATITFDSTDPDGLAAWWAQAVDGTVSAVMPGEFVLVLSKDGPNLGFQRVDDPTPGKNRLHLDFSAPDVDAEVIRLVGLGATETERHAVPVSETDDFRWVVLADPAGNAFCVAAGH
jgi:predicted enzyme related to lactoylglutathione lyase